MKQAAFNSSQIKSGDRSKTWAWSSDDDYAKPIWQGSPFGAPFFVHYGKKVVEVRQQQSEKYVYAVSTDDFWKDGDSFFLLRVLRRALHQLNAFRWEARIRTALGVLG